MNVISQLTLIGTIVLVAACGSSEPGRVQGAAAAGAATGATVLQLSPFGTATLTFPTAIQAALGMACPWCGAWT